MFKDCKSLVGLDLSSFKTDKVFDMTEMFSGCSSLTALDIRGFNTEKVTRMNNIFKGCSDLKFVTVGMKWMIQDEDVVVDLFPDSPNVNLIQVLR